jgi:Protein of unknown function (DUF3304)
MTDRPHLMNRALSLWACAGLVLVALVLAGCDGPAVTPAKPSTPDSVKNTDRNKFEKPMFNGVPLYTGPHSTPKGMNGLLLVAYNYTDLYIDNFAVNGAGGGNAWVSSKDHSYGGGACCAPIPESTPLPLAVEVSWKRDGDVPYCKQHVLLDGPIPPDPGAFEVHFYPDGTIQVAITSRPSEPRLKLDRFDMTQRRASNNVNNDSKFSRCGP